MAGIGSNFYGGNNQRALDGLVRWLERNVILVSLSTGLMLRDLVNRLPATDAKAPPAARRSTSEAVSGVSALTRSPSMSGSPVMFCDTSHSNNATPPMKPSLRSLEQTADKRPRESRPKDISAVAP